MARSNTRIAPENPQRRRLIAVSASAVAAAGLAATTGNALAQAAASAPPAQGARPLPAYAAWKDGNAMIVHSTNTIETRQSAFGTSVITPNDQLYVRNNLPPPSNDVLADRDAWQVSIEGVAQPRTLTVGQLKAMGLDTVTMVLQCSGNGRGFFPNKPSGTPWKVGAAGCVTWSGVPVRTVVEALGGANAGMVYMTGTGGEKLPDGIDPNKVMVERSVPLAAMEDALLAWELNGVPIPLAHGGPLRLIVPGFTGVNSVKYVKRLAFTAEQSPAAIQQTSYRLSPVGEKQTNGWPSVWQMSPKSWINSPNSGSAALRSGPVVIEGVAFGGMHAAKMVQVSTDGGATWNAAKFVGPDMGRYAWRQFVLVADLKPGEHLLASRVVDTEGNFQGEAPLANAGGYINSSWRDHAVRVMVA